MGNVLEKDDIDKINQQLSAIRDELAEIKKDTTWIQEAIRYLDGYSTIPF